MNKQFTGSALIHCRYLLLCYPLKPFPRIINTKAGLLHATKRHCLQWFSIGSERTGSFIAIVMTVGYIPCAVRMESGKSLGNAKAEVDGMSQQEFADGNPLGSGEAIWLHDRDNLGKGVLIVDTVHCPLATITRIEGCLTGWKAFAYPNPEYLQSICVRHDAELVISCERLFPAANIYVVSGRPCSHISMTTHSVPRACSFVRSAPQLSTKWFWPLGVLNHPQCRAIASVFDAWKSRLVHCFAMLCPFRCDRSLVVTSWANALKVQWVKPLKL